MFLFKWIIVASTLLAVLQEVLSLYGCDICIILFPDHWLIYYLLRSVCCFSLFELMYKTRFLCMIVKYFYFISVPLVDSILAKIFKFFLSNWIIVASMLYAVLQEVFYLYNCEIIIILYHWVIFYLLIFVCCFYLFEWL